MSYTTRDAEAVFKVSSQTIRNWTREFSRYLSVTATPEEGRTRLFTDADMQILELISRMKDEGKQYDEIHAALQGGKRGSLPGVSSEEIRAMVSGEVERRLHLEVQMLKRQIELAEERLAEAEQTKDENIRLHAQLEEANKQVDEFKQQLKESQEALRRLEREAGEAYYRGRLDEARSQFKQADSEQ
jgi:DNA-binding transcriptional MerR regulator